MYYIPTNRSLTVVPKAFLFSLVGLWILETNLITMHTIPPLYFMHWVQIGTVGYLAVTRTGAAFMIVSMLSVRGNITLILVSPNWHCTFIVSAKHCMLISSVSKLLLLVWWLLPTKRRWWKEWLLWSRASGDGNKQWLVIPETRSKLQNPDHS